MFRVAHTSQFVIVDTPMIEAFKAASSRDMLIGILQDVDRKLEHGELPQDLSRGTDPDLT